MPKITPFHAIHFNTKTLGSDLSALIAPPYDVLNEADKDALLSKNARNIVEIDLPHLPPKTRGPDSAYASAKIRLERNLAEGLMVRDANPALYLYHQQFQFEDRDYTRRLLFARVRLHPFSDGVILPHELTFGGPKEDRLALTQATQCNMSPIFSLFTDPEHAVEDAFADTATRTPDMTGNLEGVQNQLWVETNANVIAQVQHILAERKFYIADGHHRYGTALTYRELAAKSAGGSLPDDHPAQYVLMALASMDDPGCLIAPYHRALAEISLETILSAWKPATTSTTEDKADITLVEGSSGKTVSLVFADRGKLRQRVPDECDPWYDLDAAYLHRYLLDELLAKAQGEAPQVRYAKSADDARQVAKEQHGVALLVNATPMAHLRAVSEAGGLMPQKSTYFYPKLATGLVINPLS